MQYLTSEQTDEKWGLTKCLPAVGIENYKEIVEKQQSIRITRYIQRHEKHESR